MFNKRVYADRIRGDRKEDTEIQILGNKKSFALLQRPGNSQQKKISYF